MTTILPIEEEVSVSKKQDSVVLFNHLPQNIIQSFSNACQGIQFLEFKPENLLTAKVFVDTIIGLTPSLIKAMLNGCIPIVPYCIEVEKLLEGKGYIYNKYEEVRPLVNKAMASQTSPHEIRELANSCSTDKQDFINKWNHILGRSV